jgi:hypothetical protein
MKVSGTVSKVYTKDWNGRNGNITLHSFQIQGNNKFFRTGEKQLVRQGDTVEFYADDKGNVENLEHVEKQDAAPVVNSAPRPATAAAPAPKENWDARGAYWSAREVRDVEVVEPRITWASAQSDAVALVTAALAHDVLSFGNANKGAKLGLLLDYVDQVTSRFAAQRWDASAHVKAAVAAHGKDAPEAASAPAQTDELG